MSEPSITWTLSDLYSSIGNLSRALCCWHLMMLETLRDGLSFYIPFRLSQWLPLDCIFSPKFFCLFLQLDVLVISCPHIDYMEVQLSLCQMEIEFLNLYLCRFTSPLQKLFRNGFILVYVIFAESDHWYFFIFYFYKDEVVANVEARIAAWTFLPKGTAVLQGC